MMSAGCGQVANLEDLFVQPMLEFYQSSGVSALSKEWNAVRQAILREAVKKLVPQLQEETGNRLLAEAKEAVVEKYGDELWKYASLPPVQVMMRLPPSRILNDRSDLSYHPEEALSSNPSKDAMQWEQCCRPACLSIPAHHQSCIALQDIQPAVPSHSLGYKLWNSIRSETLSDGPGMIRHPADWCELK